VAAFDKLPGASAARWAPLSARLPDGMRGKDLLRRGSIPLVQRYYGNARIFGTTSSASSSAATRTCRTSRSPASSTSAPGRRATTT
jgi:hypothetical protein